ncbi:hypothetical protein [Tomitella gaofuii]|uniref:hypothetical protein n=1 Tax=Tomitella gaofuii TaxID=2760083 RepID=UPI0015FA7FE2|nr:hypothetical protein [Tomitella gaofuii]
METVLFGVIPVLVFIALAARSALRGRVRTPRFGAGVHAPGGDGRSGDGRGAGQGMLDARMIDESTLDQTDTDTDSSARDGNAARMREPDPIDPTRGGR